MQCLCGVEFNLRSRLRLRLVLMIIDTLCDRSQTDEFSDARYAKHPLPGPG